MEDGLLHQPTTKVISLEMKGRHGPSFLTNIHILPLPSRSLPHKSLGPIFCNITTSKQIEIRVCTHRTCRKQGSFQTLEILSGISPPENVSVKSCGCLGRCGTGPNLVVLPDGVRIGHCGTAAKAAEVMMSLCEWKEDDSRSLDALALRKRAEDEMDKGNFSQAEVLLSQAVDLKPCGGIHILYKFRSSVNLALGKSMEALKDAKEALALAPQYAEAHICEGDAFLAMDQVYVAEKSYSTALEIDPSRRRSKSFQARISKLREKLTADTVL